MCLQREAERAIVVDHVFAKRHRRKPNRRLQIVQRQFRLLEKGEAFERLRAVQRADRPECRSPVEAERAKSVGIGEFLHVIHRKARAQPDLMHRSITALAHCHQSFDVVFRQALDLSETKPDGMAALNDFTHFAMAGLHLIRIERRLLERAVPVREIDVDRPDLDAVLPGVAHELCRRIESHGLGIEDRGAEDIRVESLEPAGGIDQQCEGRGMAFGKTVIAEPLDLLEASFGELPVIAFGDHAGDELVAIVVNGAVAPECRHCPAKLVGLPRREAAGIDGDLHGLLLEERHAERSLQNAAYFRARIVDRFLALAAAKIGVDHVALNGTGAYDGDLDDEIVEPARPQPRQHGHLGAAFDLEDAERVGPTDHVVDSWILLRDRIQGQRHSILVLDAIVPVDEVEGALQA